MTLPKQIAEFLEAIAGFATLTLGVLRLQVITNDPDDDKYLECAVEGQADYIVSGDHHLTDLKTYQGIMIVDPATFIEQMVDKE
jgi:uncharacterized protein